MMRVFLAAGSVAVTLACSTIDANAVVCAAGVYRAGCVGPRGGVVVRRPYYYHPYFRPYYHPYRPYYRRYW